VSRQQLSRFLEQAARIVGLQPESRDFGQALIAPVDQNLSGNPLGGSRRAWRFEFAARQLHQRPHHRRCHRQPFQPPKARRPGR
jgi:hypothetical protein